MSILFSEAAAPSTPATGKVAVYAKTDGRVYGKDDAGTEFNMTGVASSTAQASTSGTSIDFNGLPAGLKRIVIIFSGVSTSGTSIPMVQLGDSGGIESTGYLGTATSFSNSGVSVNFTTGLQVAQSTTAATVRHGIMTICLVDSATNTWAGNWCFGRSDSAVIDWGGGSKPLSATLDRVRITTVNGTDTFDAGTVNILYE